LKLQQSGLMNINALKVPLTSVVHNYFPFGLVVVQIECITRCLLAIGSENCSTSTVMEMMHKGRIHLNLYASCTRIKQSPIR
jgi:hypothetical protein